MAAPVSGNNKMAAMAAEPTVTSRTGHITARLRAASITARGMPNRSRLTYSSRRSRTAAAWLTPALAATNRNEATTVISTPVRISFVRFSSS